MDANQELLERYVALYNAGNLDACMELYAEDAVQRMHDGTFEGKSAIQQRLARDLAAFPDATYTVVSFMGGGDRFADEWTLTGTHTGPFLMPDGTEVPGTGRRISISGMEFVEVRDGKIVVDNLYYDSIMGPIQLGLIPQLTPA
jgi:steroid delta-isomerase-like uncharacterized protein